jgi:Transposase DDE domain
LRDARRQLEQRRWHDPHPVPRSRDQRLQDAKTRLEETHAAELAAHAAFEEHHRQGKRSDGRRFAPPRQRTMPVLPEGRINVVDPDSRVMRTQGQPTVQGYNVQAAVTAGQIIVAAEVALESPDFGHLEPIFNAALQDLALAGVHERPGTVVSDAGYWHKVQMENIVSGGTQVLIPPDSSLKEKPRAGWTGGFYDFMRAVLSTERGYELYRQRKETVEPVFGHTKHNRGLRQFRRRGRTAVRSEWRLIAATHNLAKLHQHWIQPATG